MWPTLCRFPLSKMRQKPTLQVRPAHRQTFVVRQRQPFNWRLLAGMPYVVYERAI